MRFRDILETKTVKIQDAEFTLRFIPRRHWIRIASRLAVVQNALGAVNSASDKPVLNEKVREVLKTDNEDIWGTFWDLVKYGVTDHKNIVDGQGKEIPIKKDEKGYVHDDTIEQYDLNEILVPLATAAINFNQLGSEDKKN